MGQWFSPGIPVSSTKKLAATIDALLTGDDE
jgi:hypothetical protein